MVRFALAASLLCATSLETPAPVAPWAMTCDRPGERCRVSRVVVAPKHPLVMWARIEFHTDAGALKVQITTPPLFVPWVRLTLSPHGGDRSTRTSACDLKHCTFSFFVGRDNLDNLLAAESLTITVLNALGGEEIMPVDVTDLGAALRNLPRDI